ncbi:hydroxymyristoyl-ACP dehydratase [Buttiauxella sp. A2-C2_NF]|jgi:3-hydroxymyristoyl/3-hydroxydecanoyl-(acyl carrier protein) dehydratase|uniref:ApeI family dehydratase n=1 Tax=Buttiauxella TaxID=82976 RepID=UPI00105BA95E|nr:MULTISPECIES: hydroxymyristoyl-ACP dehydratase [Buttiauxella]MCE0826186.1 hydroxymyristoyl-ACP dehydratase [Buttiauxella ferragutiae]TDN51252.1 FabA-like protein [Buttiauxella sp. JUb87]UNK59865.1 hydroxymyristoyl-ACP dehydratase [Buttiauxella ferragutiae]
MKPVELQRAQPEAGKLCLRLAVPPTLGWFAGHFPTQPLLPGVAQLDWVMAYGAELAPDMRFSAIDNVKFQRPIVPQSELELNLQWDATRNVLSFSYTLLTEDGGIPASSGKIKLCP